MGKYVQKLKRHEWFLQVRSGGMPVHVILLIVYVQLNTKKTTRNATSASYRSWQDLNLGYLDTESTAVRTEPQLLRRSPRNNNQ